MVAAKKILHYATVARLDVKVGRATATSHHCRPQKSGFSIMLFRQCRAGG